MRLCSFLHLKEVISFVFKPIDADWYCNSTGAESPSGTAVESPGFDLVAGLIALIGAGALLAVRVRRPE